MVVTKPMDFLRERAEQTLNNTTARLGEVQKAHTQAAKQLGLLRQYELEYQQQLRATISGKGLPVGELLNCQSFIDSLGNVVKLQADQVEKCMNMVNDVLLVWRKDKQRLNAFETLQNRAKNVQQQKEIKQEQKLMDEFAQRACMGRKIL